MPNPPPGMHLCPTRVDGEPALFAHMITPATCQQRQREHYHKCPSCAHSNARRDVALQEKAPPAELPPLKLTALPRA